MSANLGQFQGHPIAAISLVLTNTGDGLSKAVAVAPINLELGDQVYLLIKAKVGKVRLDPMTDNPDLLTQVNILKADTITVVDHQYASAKIEEQEAANDVAAGKVKIPFGAPIDKGAVVHTDENGVVLTDAEYAERVGRGEVVVDVRPAVVVYSNEQRFMWPDEYAKDTARPVVGQLLADGSDAAVVELLDATTGEPIASAAAEVDGSAWAGDDGDPIADGFDGDTFSVDGDDIVDDDFMQPEPAEVIAAGGEIDPFFIQFLGDSVANIKSALRGQLSLQVLRGLVAAEQAGPNGPRRAVVSAIEARIAELAGS